MRIAYFNANMRVGQDGVTRVMYRTMEEARRRNHDIFVQKEVYRGLAFPAKALLAPCCFVVSIYNSIKTFYVERYVGRPVRMAGKRIRGSLRFKNDSRRESALVKDSISYQLGSAIVQALYKPGCNTILLPYRVVWLCVVGFKKRKARATKGTTRKAEKGQTDQLTSARRTRAYTERELEAVKNSFSYRLGNMLVQAIYRPGRNTILLPYHLIRLCVMEFRKRKTM